MHDKTLARTIGARLGGALVLAAGLVVAVAAPASAAPPPNDTLGGSVVIGSIPFSTTLDTSEATTDADDAQANVTCGAPATDASVWYSVTAASDGAILVDVSRSSYPAGVLAVTGSTGALEIVACGPGAIAFPTTAGTTYHLMIIDDQSDGGGNGGTLVLNVEEAPPPPVITATVSPSAGFTPSTGSATVRGTVTCTGVAEFAFLDIELHQRVGRGEVVGAASVEVLCDGTTTPWEVEVFPTFGGKFAGGKGASLTFAVACGLVDCSIDFQEHVVQLSRR